MATSAPISNFADWLGSRLEALSLDAEVFGGYVMGIMEDEDNEVDDRVESVCNILSGATEEDLTEFKGALAVQWENHQTDTQRASQEQDAARREQDERRKEDERRLLQEADEQRRAKAAAELSRNKEERRERERLLNTYGFDVDAVDEEGNLIDKAEPTGDSMVGMDANTNKTRVADIAKQQRETAKATHEQKVARDKMLQQREKMKKELAKKGTQKREKQRGHG